MAPAQKPKHDETPAPAASAGLDAPAPSTTPDEVAALGFEAALARLEAVVVRLEKGELSLEESLASYEQGVRLAQAARGRLEGLQGRLEQLLADGTTVPLQKRSADERGQP